MAQLTFLTQSDIVFDLETKRSFDEVGGRANLTDLGISLGVVYDYNDTTYHIYRDDQVDGLVQHILKAGRLIGFNITGFDLPLLKPLFPIPAPKFKTLDLMDEAKKHLRFRPSLQKLAEATLNEGKAGGGLDAITWYREGNWDALIHYCREDVRITKDLYEFGKKHHHLLFKDRDGRTLKVPVYWE